MKKIKKIPSITTCYGPVAQEVIKRARDIRLLIFDIDGVMSNGIIYIGNHGEELKTFHVRDGYGIRCMLTAGIEVAIITGCSEKLVADRCVTLGIRHLYQNQVDKIFAFKELISKLTLQKEQVAYVGDDMIDVPVIDQVGLSVAVADSHPLLRHRVDYITHMAGGQGAVREVCDLILLAKGKLEDNE